MGTHLDFGVPQVKVRAKAHLLFVCFHPSFKPIVEVSHLGGIFSLEVVQELYDLNIMLKLCIRQFMHVNNKRQLHFLYVLRKDRQVPCTIVFVFGIKA